MRANESPEQRRARQDRDLLWHQNARAATPSPSPRRGRARGRGRGGARGGRYNDIILEKAAIGYDPQNFNLHEHDIWNIGTMENVCQHCNARTFKDEAPGLCCKKGKVDDVPCIPPPPEELLSLYSNDGSQSKNYLGNLRKYNQAFAMTSVKTKFIVEPGFMPTVKIEGQLSHLIGSLRAPEGEEAKFLQIYFIGMHVFTFFIKQISSIHFHYLGDPEAEINRRRMVANLPVDPTIDLIRQVMHEKNPYIQRFKYLLEHDTRIRDPGAKIVINANRFTNQFHRGTLNAANPEDFAAIVTDERGGGHYRDIQIQVRGGDIQKINEYHRSYDALQYPILLWNGQVN